MDEKTSESDIYDFLQGDGLLQILVKGANDSDLKWPITLNVGGLLISGKIVGNKKYMDHFATLFNDDKVREELKKVFAEAEAARKETSVEDELPCYIHLEDAKFYNTTGKPIPANKGVWWRGRISEVQGFFYGLLEVAES
jgi:hypothetical protein